MILSALQNALSTIRDKANNDTELGNAFERLSKVFLENDATQTQQDSQVWHYSDWAKEQEGRFTAVIPGENYDTFNKSAVDMRSELSNKEDRDFNNRNPGITIFWL